MPITKSAKKALRQSLRKKDNNLFHKNRVNKIVKQIKELSAENKKDEAKKLVSLAYKYIDKAAKSRVIKKNTASRKKSLVSRLTK